MNDNDREFLDFLKKASKEVKSWPKWKQELLGPFKIDSRKDMCPEVITNLAKKCNFGEQLKKNYNEFQKRVIEGHFEKIMNMLIEESEKSVPPYKYKIEDLDYENSKILADNVRKEGFEVENNYGFNGKQEFSITFKK